jgi:hypothetical protein|tara:strand:+ start:681 stop:953 length:273 start_codon:yes stop_codon:yes gene_type:complete
MFNDKITQKISESVKEVLEAKKRVPPVVTGSENRVAPSDTQQEPANIPPETLVRTGRGKGLSKDIKTTDAAMTPIKLPDVKNRIRKFFGR